MGWYRVSWLWAVGGAAAYLHSAALRGYFGELDGGRGALCCATVGGMLCCAAITMMAMVGGAGLLLLALLAVMSALVLHPQLLQEARQASRHPSRLISGTNAGVPHPAQPTPDVDLSRLREVVAEWPDDQLCRAWSHSGSRLRWAEDADAGRDPRPFLSHGHRHGHAAGRALEEDDREDAQ